MVAINYQTRAKSYGPRSNDQQSTSQLGYTKESCRSRRDTFVVSEQFTESFVADYLLAISKRIINLGPLPRKRSIVQCLMRAKLVVIVEVRSDKVVEVLLAKDDEEAQALCLIWT